MVLPSGGTAKGVLGVLLGIYLGESLGESFSNLG
jgi:hypothetical protein